VEDERLRSVCEEIIKFKNQMLPKEEEIDIKKLIFKPPVVKKNK